MLPLNTVTIDRFSVQHRASTLFLRYVRISCSSLRNNTLAAIATINFNYTTQR